MRVVPVHGEIPFVADRMFPVPSLPDPALAARVMTGDLRSPFGKGHSARRALVTRREHP